MSKVGPLTFAHVNPRYVNSLWLEPAFSIAANYRRWWLGLRVEAFGVRVMLIWWQVFIRYERMSPDGD